MGMFLSLRSTPALGRCVGLHPHPGLGLFQALIWGLWKKKKKYSPAGVFLINLRLFCTK